MRASSVPANKLSFPHLTFAEDISLVMYINITIIPPINKIVTTKNAHEIFLTPNIHLTKKAEQINLHMAIYGDLVSPVIRDPIIKKYTHINLCLIKIKPISLSTLIFVVKAQYIFYTRVDDSSYFNSLSYAVGTYF